ncbi:MAG: CcmD family protein [Bacteroidetes bacterium]|nr:CcmD family protein [Bacteroidota bacterium]MBS1973255.1 CcmD family protein [Bacteroidota bacterium]
MHKKLSRILFTIFASLLTLPSWAQDSADKAQMAGVMRSNGKIYVVVAVLVIILLGLLFYLVRLDRKISKMEKN